MKKKAAKDAEMLQKTTLFSLTQYVMAEIHGKVSNHACWTSVIDHLHFWKIPIACGDKVTALIKGRYNHYEQHDDPPPPNYDLAPAVALLGGTWRQPPDPRNEDDEELAAAPAVTPTEAKLDRLLDLLLKERDEWIEERHAEEKHQCHDYLHHHHTNKKEKETGKRKKEKGKGKKGKRIHPLGESSESSSGSASSSERSDSSAELDDEGQPQLEPSKRGKVASKVRMHSLTLTISSHPLLYNIYDCVFKDYSRNCFYRCF